jgi:DNA-binding NtrC family response regulator
MTAQSPAVLRAVVLPSSDIQSQDTPTRRLLGGMGHDVSRAISPDHAMELMSTDHTDLLVVDITNNSRNRDLINSISDLPEGKRPDQVAIFADAIDNSLKEFRRDIAPSHVHVFLKPLHMHGLLNVLRHMERQQSDKSHN